MNGPVDISPGHLRVVKEILHKNVPSGVAIWVFGSRASWATSDSSDLDLALEGDIDHDTILALEMAFEESSLPYTVDVIDLDQISDSFRRIVEAQKIPLDDADKPKSSVDQWPSLQFGDCAELVRDTVLPTELGDTPYIGLEHLGEGTLSLNGCGNASDVSSIKGRFRQGDILFGKLRPYFRKIFRADFDGVCSTDIWVVRPTAKTDADYLFYLMASKEFVDVATRGSEGTRMPRAKWNWVSQYKVPVPSLNDQHAIAHILRTLDDKIDLNQRMNQTMEEMARALFKSWFVDFDPICAKIDGRWRCGECLLGLPASYYNIFPDRLVDSDLGRVPEGWEVKALGELVNVVGGSTPSTKESEYWQDGIHCWATPKDLSTLSVPVLLDTKRRITDAGLERISSGLLPAGTLLLSARAPIGYLAINEVPTAINQGFIAMPPTKTVSNLFMLHWCKMFHNEIINYANGSTFLEINKNNFRLIKAIIPDQKIMTVFDNHIRPFYERIVSNERESLILAVKRDTLLPKLMSGEFCIKPNNKARRVNK